MSATNGPEPTSNGGPQSESTGRSTEKKRWGPFRKALAATAIPVVALGVIGSAGLALGASWLMGGVLTISSVGLFAAFVVAIVFAIRGKRQTAAGILAGIGIGIVALGATCFANMSRFPL